MVNNLTPLVSVYKFVIKRPLILIQNSVVVHTVTYLTLMESVSVQQVNQKVTKDCVCLHVIIGFSIQILQYALVLMVSHLILWDNASKLQN